MQKLLVIQKLPVILSPYMDDEDLYRGNIVIHLQEQDVDTLQDKMASRPLTSLGKTPKTLSEKWGKSAVV